MPFFTMKRVNLASLWFCWDGKWSVCGRQTTQFLAIFDRAVAFFIPQETGERIDMPSSPANEKASSTLQASYSGSFQPWPLDLFLESSLTTGLGLLIWLCCGVLYTWSCVRLAASINLENEENERYWENKIIIGHSMYANDNHGFSLTASH